MLSLATLVAVSGCNTDPGPNDPVVDGKKLNNQREANMSDADKALMHGQNAKGR